MKRCLNCDKQLEEDNNTDFCNEDCEEDFFDDEFDYDKNEPY